MSKTHALTAERLKELLSYDPDTGEFRWKARSGEDWTTKSWNTRCAGKIAGSLGKRGYRCIKIDDVLHKASRLAHLYMTGTHPVAEIDHIKGIRDDDRWGENLRAATSSQNQRNRRVQANNKLGVKGVRFNPRFGKYMARICDDAGQSRYLGSFSTITEAAAAYNRAAEELHRDFAKPTEILKVKLIRYGGELPDDQVQIGPEGTVVDVSYVQFGEDAA